MKGGKKYKSGKHTETKIEIHEVNEADGQMIGRVIKNLGDRNMIVYCNDGNERVSHIRGGLRKKVAKIEIGDVVLISLRSMEEGSSLKNRADILAKYDRETHSQLKKTDGANPLLFMTIETMDSRTRVAIKDMKPDEQVARAKNEYDDGFDFDYGSEGESNNEETKEAAREKKKETEDKKRAAARTVKQTVVDDNGEINIDAI